MKRRVWIAAVAAAVSLPGAARAGDHIYPWKANVPRATFDAEQAECVTAARAAMKDPGVPNPYMQPAPGTGTAGAMGSASASGMARGLAQGKAYNNTYYGCMVAKGYSERRFPGAEYTLLRKLPKAEQLTRIFALMSAPEPLHPEMPRDEYD